MPGDVVRRRRSNDAGRDRLSWTCCGDRSQKQRGRTMNQYGAMAERHWRRWLPSRVAAMDHPSSFFSNLGEEAAARIEDMTADLAGGDPAGGTVMGKVGRLNLA